MRKVRYSLGLDVKGKTPEGCSNPGAWLDGCIGELSETITCLSSGSRNRPFSGPKRSGRSGREPKAAGKLGKIATGDVLRNEEGRLMLGMLYRIYQSRGRSRVPLKHVEFLVKLQAQPAPNLALVSITQRRRSQRAKSNILEMIGMLR